MARMKKIVSPKKTNSYKHPDASALMRPELGTQAQFRKKKEPVKYRYDSSLDPEMSWDERKRYSMYRQRRDVDRRMGLQHGDPYYRVKTIYVSTPLRTGGRQGTAQGKLCH